MAEKHNAEEFIIKDNEKRPISKVIAEVAREKHITQIVLGQTAQSRWEQMTKGSIINTLLREIPFVDLHIISVLVLLKIKKVNLRKGVRAYLVKENEQYRYTNLNIQKRRNLKGFSSKNMAQISIMVIQIYEK